MSQSPVELLIIFFLEKVILFRSSKDPKGYYWADGLFFLGIVKQPRLWLVTFWLDSSLSHETALGTVGYWAASLTSSLDGLAPTPSGDKRLSPGNATCPLGAKSVLLGWEPWCCRKLCWCGSKAFFLEDSHGQLLGWQIMVSATPQWSDDKDTCLPTIHVREKCDNWAKC